MPFVCFVVQVNVLYAGRMKQIAQILLFDRDNRLIIYLRDNKPEIPFPNHWDLIGGHVEEGETPEQALAREVREEIGIDLRQWQFFRRYDCFSGDAYPNIKFIYHGRTESRAAELPLYEGQRLAAIEARRTCEFRFANILATIVDDFIAANLWPCG